MRGAVMTCPQREALWPAVDARFPNWPLVVDDGRGLVECFCRTLEHAAGMGSEWAVMVQDDVEPCAAVPECLSDILAEVPGGAVLSGFSMGWKRDPADLARGMRWRRRRRGELLWVMLLAVPVGMVPALVAGVRAGAGPHDDERLSRWLDESGTPAYTHLPSLVQHVGQQSVTRKGWTIGGHPRQSPTWRREWTP